MISANWKSATADLRIGEYRDVDDEPGRHAPYVTRIDQTFWSAADGKSGFLRKMWSGDIRHDVFIAAPRTNLSLFIFSHHAKVLLTDHGMFDRKYTVSHYTNYYYEY